MSLSSLPPNATGSYTFPGYNLSQPYPGKFLEDSKFSWDVSLWGNVQYSNTTKIRTWAQYSLGVDKDLLRSTDGDFEIDESWSFCGRYWEKQVSDIDQEVNEDCSEFVSKKCLDSLRSLADQLNYCDFPAVPRSCHDDDFEYGWSHLPRALHNYTGWDGSSDSLLEDGDKVYFPGLQSDGIDKEDFERYDNDIRTVTISILGFGKTPKDKGDDVAEVLPGSLRCVRAKPVEGSRTLEEGGAGLRAAPLLIGAILVPLLSSMLLL